MKSLKILIEDTILEVTGIKKLSATSKFDTLFRGKEEQRQKAVRGLLNDYSNKIQYAFDESDLKKIKKIKIKNEFKIYDVAGNFYLEDYNIYFRDSNKNEYTITVGTKKTPKGNLNLKGPNGDVYYFYKDILDFIAKNENKISTILFDWKEEWEISNSGPYYFIKALYIPNFDPSDGSNSLPKYKNVFEIHKGMRVLDFGPDKVITDSNAFKVGDKAVLESNTKPGREVDGRTKHNNERLTIKMIYPIEDLRVDRRMTSGYDLSFITDYELKTN